MSLERDFTAWLDNADPNALGRVFDATAGRLLLLAAHVTGADGTAEDLVQSTFLAAISKGATWDRDRPLWPWLATVLHNEARMQWRRQRTRREVSVDRAADLAADSLDPARLAESDETFARVVESIDALPVHYRQVLRLRLVHGLQQVEIARALELPIGTVRAQVHRGLAKLRDALPASVAVAGWLASSDELLANVRVHVLERAAAMAKAATVVTEGSSGGVATAAALGTAGGWWAMHGKATAIVAAGVALLLCIGFLIDTPTEPSDRDVERPRPTPEVADFETASTESSDLTETVERQDTNAEPSVAWPLVVLARQSSGAPVAGARVEVWVASRGIQIVNQRQGDSVRESIAEGVTDADGRSRCSLDAVRARSVLARCSCFVFVHVTHPTAGVRKEILGLPRSTEPRAFSAEVEFRTAVGIRGRVVDHRGEPLAGVELYSLRDGQARFVDTYQRSAVDGAFCVPVEDPESPPDRIAAIDARFGAATVAVPRVEEGESYDVGDVALAAGSEIRGRVVLGDGGGLAGFPVVVTEIDPELANADSNVIRKSLFGNGSRRRPYALRDGLAVHVRGEPITDRDGAFVCRGLDPKAVYAVFVRDSAGRTELTVARPGSDTVTLRLERQLVTIELLDEQGSLLPGIDLLAQGWDPAGKWPSPRKYPGFPEVGLASRNSPFCVDADGRLMLLSPFEWVWRFEVQDELARADFLRHDALVGVYRSVRQLPLVAEDRYGSLHLVVVDENGDPLSNYGAVLRCLDRELEHNDRRMVPPDGGRKWQLIAGRWSLDVLLGREVLYAPRLDSYARGLHQQEIVIEQGQELALRIVAEPKGQIALRLRAATLPASGNWDGLRIETAPAGEAVAFVGHDHRQAWSSRPTPRCDDLVVLEGAWVPGRHEFIVRVDGYRPVRCSVEAKVDELVRVGVELVAD